MEEEQLNILLDGLRNGNKDMFNQLFLEYYERLVCFANGYTHSQEDSEDIVSSLFVAIWHNRKKFPHIKSLDGYLFKAIKNRCINFKRDHNNHKIVPIEGFSDSVAINKGEKELENFISNSINQLPEQRRLVYILIKECGLKTNQLRRS